jgi:hypothetical protein
LPFGSTRANGRANTGGQTNRCGGLVVVSGEVLVLNSGWCRTFADAQLPLAIATAACWW